MKPTLRKAVPEVESSFIMRSDSGHNMINCWHYHSECEIVYIKKSVGTWLVGDYEGKFSSGDIIFIGGGVPHSYVHDQQYVDNDQIEQGQALITLFSPQIFGDSFLNLPESKEIKNILELSKRGLKIHGNTRSEIAKIMEEIPYAQKGRKLINLLNILQLITEGREYDMLATEGYSGQSERTSNTRLNLIIQFTYLNYQRQISIEDVSALVNMSVHSFCRFFKDKTKKTYIQFLTEVRIGQACKFLIEGDMHSAEVGYCCGYNSISHFNHQFKLLKNKSPLEFKKSYLNILGN